MKRNPILIGRWTNKSISALRIIIIALINVIINVTLKLSFAGVIDQANRFKLLPGACLQLKKIPTIK